MRRLTFVGELNPYGPDDQFALYPEPPQATGGRLCRILGLDPDDYLAKYGRVNLCTGAWNAYAARHRADTLLKEGDRFVLLGAKVARIFTKLPPLVPFFSVVELVGAKALLLPHPSGLCRVWNEPDAEARARRAFSDFSEGGDHVVENRLF